MIEPVQQGIRRLFVKTETRTVLRTDKEKRMPVVEYDGERCQPPRNIERMEMSRLSYGLHSRYQSVGA